MEVQTVVKIISQDFDKIILCPDCKGSGIVMDDSWGAHASDTVNCPTCEGAGRVIDSVIECTVYYPYKNKNKKFRG